MRSMAVLGVCYTHAMYHVNHGHQTCLPIPVLSDRRANKNSLPERLDTRDLPTTPCCASEAMPGITNKNTSVTMKLLPC